jgi:hypothetical protein
MNQNTPPYYQAFSGRFSGVLHWDQLDELWKILQEAGSDDWFIYAVGDSPPEESSLYLELENFIKEVNTLLRQDHDESYCGIVYVDNFTQPTFIKIFDPNNLGTSCSTGLAPPLPAWVLSKMPPIDLPSAMPPTQSRKRWWKRLFN